MKKLLALIAAVGLSGCATINPKIVAWPTDSGYNNVRTADGRMVQILGNPRISCYNKYGELLADGFFVRTDGPFLIVDEFGKDYAFVRNNLDSYCILFNGQ